MTQKPTLLQVGEICLVCATELEVENRPVSLADVKVRGLLVTRVHRECLPFVKCAMQSERLTQNALQWAQYATPLIEAEESRIAAAQQAAIAERSRIAAQRQARAAAKEQKDRAKLERAQEAWETRLRSNRSYLQTCIADNEEFPSAHARARVEQAEQDIVEAEAKLREIDAQLATYAPHPAAPSAPGPAALPPV